MRRSGSRACFAWRPLLVMWRKCRWECQLDNCLVVGLARICPLSVPLYLQHDRVLGVVASSLDVGVWVCPCYCYLLVRPINTYMNGQTPNADHLPARYKPGTCCHQTS